MDLQKVKIFLVILTALATNSLAAKQPKPLKSENNAPTESNLPDDQREELVVDSSPRMPSSENTLDHKTKTTNQKVNLKSDSGGKPEAEKHSEQKTKSEKDSGPKSKSKSKPIHVALVSGCDSHLSSMTPIAYSLLHHSSAKDKYRVTFVIGSQCRDIAEKLKADFYDSGPWFYPGNETGFAALSHDLAMGPLTYGYPAVDSFVKHDKPDLILAELFNCRVSLIAELNNIPYATIWAGATPHPSMYQAGYLLNAGLAGLYIPSSDKPRWVLDYFTTLFFSQASVVWGYFQQEANELFNSMVREKGIKKEFRDAFHIMNSYPSLALAGPPIFPLKEVPGKLYITGMQPTEIADLKEMSPEIRAFIEKSDKDILYVALGTYAVFSDEQFEIMKKAFLKQGRFNIIWSHAGWSEEKEMKEEYDRSRMFIRQKQPQKEIFTYSKVKAFLSHCGASSMMEGVSNLKAFIGCPQMRDQELTSKVITKYNFGTVVSPNPSEDELLTAVENIYQNLPTYLKNVKMVNEESSVNAVQKLEKFVDSMVAEGKTIQFDVEESNYMPFWLGVTNLALFLSIVASVALSPLVLLCCVCCRCRKTTTKNQKKTQ